MTGDLQAAVEIAASLMKVPARVELKRVTHVEAAFREV